MHLFSACLKSALALAAFVIAGCHAEPATKVAQCKPSFLSNDGAWEASVFDDTALRPSSTSELGTFTPIEKIYVQAGKLYVQTWAAEPDGTTITETEDGMAIRPRYMVWLGSDDDIGREAKKLVPYGNKSTKHLLSIEGSCSDPSRLEVDIYLLPSEKRHKVQLRKISNAHFEI